MSNFTEVALSSAAWSDRGRCFACLVWIYTTRVAILNFMRSTLTRITSRSIRQRKKNMMRAFNMFYELVHKGYCKKSSCGKREVKFSSKFLMIHIKNTVREETEQQHRLPPTCLYHSHFASNYSCTLPNSHPPCVSCCSTGLASVESPV